MYNATLMCTAQAQPAGMASEQDGSSSLDSAGEEAEANESARKETRSQMQQRHKQEMLAEKKAVRNLGKKNKQEAERRLRELEQRHQAELEELDRQERQQAESSEGQASSEKEAVVGKEKGGAVTKAQRRRERRRREEEEREKKIEEAKAAEGPSARQEEEEALRSRLEPRGLRIAEVKPDGHCMYRAVADQVHGHDDEGTVEELRRSVASHLRQHRDDYEAFLEGEGGADPFEEYCRKVEGTAAWGGQLEAGALARCLGRPLIIHSAHLDDVVMGEDLPGEPLRLAYQRHAFGLGEHYNSVRPSC